MRDCQKFSPNFWESSWQHVFRHDDFIHRIHQEEALAALASAEDTMGSLGWIDTDFKHLMPRGACCESGSQNGGLAVRGWWGDGKSRKEEWSTVSFVQGISSSWCRKVDLLMSEKWPVPCLFLLSCPRFHPLSQTWHLQDSGARCKELMEDGCGRTWQWECSNPWLLYV